MSTPLWSLQRGATIVGDGAARFDVWAPMCEHVAVRVEGGEAAGDWPLARDERGVWSGTVRGVRAGDRYRYVVASGDARQELPDPVSRSQPEGVHGPSAVVDPGAFRWTDEEWRGLPMADLVIYEMHVGTFSDEGTFDGAIAHLRGLADLGVTAIEIMPVAEFPGARNWGYDGVAPYAPQSTYGGPEGLRRLVDAAHAAGLAVILDVVYNHMGPEGNYLPVYGPYFSDRYKTPWGSAVNYDGPESDEVRRYVIDNALYWVTEFHLDGLRLDAVHAIFDFGARHLLEELADAVRAQGRLLGRATVVIGESDLNDPRLLRPAERGGYALDGQWSDDFHHAVHAELTAERSGYYADYGGVGAVATALADRFVYAGRYAPSRKRRHGAPAGDVSADHFVICLQNHDQVGNRAAGDRLTALTTFPQRKLAAALMLLSPYVPMLFMGEEYGEPRPFQYFVSHGDEALVEAVRKGRREEFAAFGWADDVPDPQAEATFRASTLDRSHAETPEGAATLALYRDLLRLRREEPALRPGDAEAHVQRDEAEGWIAVEMRPTRGGAATWAVFNLAPHPRRVPVPPNASLLLDTEDARYAGTAASGDEIAPASARLYRLAPAR